MARWTDPSAYANLPDPDGLDVLPIADVSQPDGLRQRHIRWEQLAAAAGGATELTDLSDVDTSGVATGDVLTFDGAEWSPAAPTSGGSPNVTVRTITGNDTPTDSDSGARLNVTAEADISLDDDLEDGAWFVVRAETADPVQIVVTGTATMSPAGPLELVPFTAALCTHITGGAWQVEGAFEE